MTCFRILLFLCCFTISLPARAQQVLKEGVLVYQVRLWGKLPDTGREAPVADTQSGSMTIHIKEDKVCREIRMEDGYRHARISNYATGKNIILKTLDQMKYAVEIPMKEERRKQSQYYGAVLEKGPATKMINGRTAREARLKYRNGTVFALHYIDSIALEHPEIFEPCPELNGIPAAYELPLNNGFTARFELLKVSEEPVSNTVFRVPEGYRIISKKEYEKLVK